MWPKEENVIDKMQPETGFFENRVEVLFKEAHEQVGIGGGHMDIHFAELRLGCWGEFGDLEGYNEDKVFLCICSPCIQVTNVLLQTNFYNS